MRKFQLPMKFNEVQLGFFEAIEWILFKIKDPRNKFHVSIHKKKERKGLKKGFIP